MALNLNRVWPLIATAIVTLSGLFWSNMSSGVISSNGPDGNNGTLIQIASYNTNLQGTLGLPQDLVDWLKPTLSTSSNFTPTDSPPDFVAVGFQELLPLHLGFTGQSQTLLASRSALILKEIEKYSHGNVRYSLVASIVNVGVALLVYAKDEGVGRRVCDVQTSWTGCGPLSMGNKGAVAVRFRVRPTDAGEGETFTFVNFHLTAHAHNLKHRLKDYTHIVRTLLFQPTQGSSSNKPTTIYHTSHLFALGDFNFRLAKDSTLDDETIYSNLTTSEGLRHLARYDELSREIQAGSVCNGLREGDFAAFPPTYKYVIGSETEYGTKRLPAWTDRILYTTFTDSPTTPNESSIQPLLYTSIPSYTTSDHKPITALLRIPPSPWTSASTPILAPPPEHLTAASYPNLYRYRGKVLGWIIGWVWYVFNVIGLGNAGVGVGNFVLGLGAATWWKRQRS